MLLDNVTEAGMRCSLSTAGGRDVGRQLAHLQDVRIYQLTSRAKTLAPDTRKFATAEEPDHATLHQALDDTAARIENWLSMVHNGEKGVADRSRLLFVKGVVLRSDGFDGHLDLSDWARDVRTSSLESQGKNCCQVGKERDEHPHPHRLADADPLASDARMNPAR